MLKSVAVAVPGRPPRSGTQTAAENVATRCNDEANEEDTQEGAQDERLCSNTKDKRKYTKKDLLQHFEANNI